MRLIGIVIWFASALAFAHETVTVAKGLQVQLFATGLKGAENLSVGPFGTVFVSAPNAGVIHALVDKNQDGRYERKVTLNIGLRRPQGLAFVGNDLYVVDNNRLLKYVEVEQHLSKRSQFVVVATHLPLNSENQSNRYLSYGPDNWLYLSLGSGCNVCQPEAPNGAIVKLHPKTGEMQQVAIGVRNVGGFDWHPQTQQLWFSDNSRDWLGDNLPADEINTLEFTGEHFGFPYLHAGDVKEKSFVKPAQLKISQPKFLLPAHVAPAGVMFYEGEMLPKRFRGSLLVAERGSRYRSSKVGYQVTSIQFDEQGTPTSRSTILSFLDSGFAIASPTDIAQLKDGSVIISDRLGNKIYRIIHLRERVNTYADRENKL